MSGIQEGGRLDGVQARLQGGPMDFEQVRQQLETALELQAPGHGWSVQRDLTDRSHERVLVCSARPSHAMRCKGS